MAIIVNIDVMLAKRKMSVTELADKVGITMANLSSLISRSAAPGRQGEAMGIYSSTSNLAQVPAEAWQELSQSRGECVAGRLRFVPDAPVRLALWRKPAT